MPNLTTDQKRKLEKLGLGLEHAKSTSQVFDFLWNTTDDELEMCLWSAMTGTNRWEGFCVIDGKPQAVSSAMRTQHESDKVLADYAIERLERLRSVD